MPGIARMRTVVFDCPDPLALAEFYRDLLGWELSVDEEDEDWVELTGPDGRLAFQRVADYQPPIWPGQERPQQMHIDVTVDDVDEAEPKVLALGAVKHEIQPGGTWRVFLDPVGHPFCLCWD
jgi:predicted enzyme related to lactoylglutathione lyase